MESSHYPGQPNRYDSGEVEAAIIYTVFSVHHLGLNRDLVPGPALQAAQDALSKNPVAPQVGPDWPDHADLDESGKYLLLDANRVYECFDQERRTWLRKYLHGELGLSEEEAEGIEHLLDGVRPSLLRLVTLARQAFLLGLEQGKASDLPGEVHGQAMASIAWSLGYGEPSSFREMALEQAALSRQEAREALPFLMKVTPWLERWLEEADDAIHDADRPRRWETLWEDPGESTLAIFNDLGTNIFLLLAPTLVSEADYQGSEQLQERWLLAIDAVHAEGIQEEQARDVEAVSRLRSSPKDLPVVSRLTLPVCNILNTYFANWRLRTTPGGLAKNIKSRLNRL